MFILKKLFWRIHFHGRNIIFSKYFYPIIRKIFDQSGRFPPSFEIIAPMAAVRVKRGQIPSYYIKYLDHSYYINLRQQYLGH